MTASFEIPAHEATGNGVVKSEKRTCVGRVRALLARTGNSNPGLIVICIQYQSAAPLGGKLARNKRHSSRAVLASTLNAALRAVARLADRT